jgi:hypoxia up-regulated 1
MDKEDKARQMREESRNELESFIYSSRDITFESKYETFSTLEEREKLSKALTEASEWMEDHDTEAKREDFKEKLKSLKAIASPIFLRTKEDSLRPLAVTEFEEVMDTCKQLVEKLDAGLEKTGRLWTNFEKLAKMVESNDKWFEETSKSQSQLTSIQDPVLLSSDLKGRISLLLTAQEGLMRIQASREKEIANQKKEEEKSKSKAASGTAEADETKSPEDDKEDAAGAEKSEKDQQSKEDHAEL